MNSKRQRQQERFIAELLQHGSVADAAKAAKISTRTATTWLADADFQREYLAARRQLVSHAIGRLQKVGGKAIERLAKLVDSADEGIALKAASNLLAMLLKLREHDELDERITVLEEMHNARVNTIDATSRRSPRIIG